MVSTVSGEASNLFAADLACKAPMLLETLSAIGSGVTGAIQKAAQATGTGFGYLLATAQIESGLRPEIKAKTSSATGLFQFIEQTWLATMKQSGAEFGYGRYANAIEKLPSGRHVVKDPALRAEILNLRKDPSANAAMAGALTRSNAARLRGKLGREATDGELYMAHFLGAGGAARLISAREQNPNVRAADLFPRAAAANRPIFYDKQGGTRSVNGVYGVLATKLARAMPTEGAAQVAQARPATRVAPIGQPRVLAATEFPPRPPAAVQQARRPASAPAPEAFARTGFTLLGPTRVAAVAPSVPMPPLDESVAPLMFAQTQSPLVGAVPAVAPPPVATAASGRPSPAATVENAFLDLFRTEGRGAVSKAVSELWGVRAPAAPSSDAITALNGRPPQSSERVRPLDLFRTSRSPT
jgi:hypothetical protein